MELLENYEDEIKEEKNEIKCAICGDPHFYRKCKYVTLTSKIKDKEIPTIARLSLPDMLEIKKLADESNSVFTKSMIEVGTEFGPFIAKKNLTLNPFTSFPLKLFMESESDLSEYYLDTTDENECCWMMFVNPASDVEEQNLICYQEGEDVFFGSIRDIPAGEQLKVWYSPYYAFKMQKCTLSFKESSKLHMESEIKKNDYDLNSLIKEQQKIVPRVVWNCKFCYKLEKNVTNFARHLMSHYNIHKRKTCEHCNQRFQYNQDYKKHIKLHHNNSSDGIFAKRLQVATRVDEHSSNKPHLEIKNNTIGGPLLLQFLNDSLDNSSLLMQQPEVNSFEIENYENQNILLDSDNLRLNVDVIGNSMKDLDDFNSDTKTKELEIKELMCDICLRKFRTLKAISLHLKFHIGKYFCSTCKKVFGRSENLKQHKCNQIYSLKCPKCEKIFYQKKYLVKHISVVHDKKHICAVCKNFYYSPTELRNHVCKKVPKEKRRQFICDLCPKKLSNKKYLKRHIKIHSTVKEKPQTAKHICFKCSYIFLSDVTYKRHLISVHNMPRDYECHICDKNFSRKDILKSHMINVHNMLERAKVNKCMKCNKEYKSKRSFDFHIKTTHNDSQYKCHCGAVFKYSRNLARHIKKTHKSNVDILTEEMHQCPICTTTVKLKRSLQRHIRQKHPGEYKNRCVELNAKKKRNIQEIHTCPICHDKFNSMLSVDRHFMKTHPKERKHICADLNITKETVEKQKKDFKIYDDEFDTYIDTDQKCMDLQKTIETMDFSIDGCNDNLLSGSETIDKFLKESSDQISIMFTDSPKISNVNDTGMTVMTDKISNNEVCLSMPDLSEMDQEVKLSKNPYILDTANILEPQEDPTSVVVCVLKENSF